MPLALFFFLRGALGSFIVYDSFAIHVASPIFIYLNLAILFLCMSYYISFVLSLKIKTASFLFSCIFYVSSWAHI